MKILISDYSSDLSTEPLYLNTCFNNAGCKSTLLSNSTSIYDGFDMVDPDIYITHHQILSKDLLLYLKENQTKKIDLVINVTGMNQDDLSRLDSIFSDNNIKPALYFVNHYDSGLRSRNNIVSILYGADLFLSSEKKQYDIDYGIFIQSKEELGSIGETYHYITYNKNIDKIADIFLPTNRLTHLYHNYNHIVFKYFDGIFPQVFFDAAIKVNSVFFDLTNNNDKNKLNKHIGKLLGEGNHCKLSDLDSGKIREQINSKHTCLHRAKSLLSQLPAKEYIDNLQKIIDNRGKI